MPSNTPKQDDHGDGSALSPPDIEFVFSRSGVPAMYLNGFMYRRTKVRGTTEYWSCAVPRCRSSGLSKDGILCKLKATHEHPPGARKILNERWPRVRPARKAKANKATSKSHPNLPITNQEALSTLPAASLAGFNAVKFDPLRSFQPIPVDQARFLVSTSENKNACYAENPQETFSFASCSNNGGASFEQPIYAFAIPEDRIKCEDGLADVLASFSAEQHLLDSENPLTANNSIATTSNSLDGFSVEPSTEDVPEPEQTGTVYDRADSLTYLSDEEVKRREHEQRMLNLKVEYEVLQLKRQVLELKRNKLLRETHS